jgi:hypothetical protein
VSAAFPVAWSRRLIAAAALALLAGCSATRFAYDNAEFYLRWQAGRYLDLRGEQRELRDMRIAAFMAWHRAEAMPVYARLSAEAAERFGDGLSRDDLDWGYDSIRVQVRLSLRRAAEELAPLLDRLSPEQIAHLERRLEDDNRKFADEHLQGTLAERKARHLRRNLERLEEWLGTLSDAQIERARQYAERAPLVDELREIERRRRQGELLEMLRRREAGLRLADWAANWDRERAPAYEAALRAQREEYFRLLLDLDTTLNAGQRRSALARLEGYSSDFLMLARQSGVRSVSQ